MENLPAAMEPLDRAILGLVSEMPPVWTVVDYDRLPSRAAEALTLLVKAGLAEGRVRLVLTMDKFVEVVRLQFCLGGEYTTEDVLRPVWQSLPSKWIDGDRLRENLRISGSGLYETRLTDQGELAREDIASGNPGRVVEFVRKQGFFKYRRKVKGVVRLESCETEDAEDVVNGTTVAAQAIASVGDTVIENQVHVDAGAICSALADAVEKLTQSRTETDTQGQQQESTKGKGMKSGGGRLRDPEIVRRNKKIVKAFKEGSSVNEVCERFGVSADLARKVKSQAGLGHKRNSNEDES